RGWEAAVEAHRIRQVQSLPKPLQEPLMRSEAKAAPGDLGDINPRLGGILSWLKQDEKSTKPSVGERMFVDGIGQPIAQVVISPIAQLSGEINRQRGYPDDPMLDRLADLGKDTAAFTAANPPESKTEAFARRVGSAVTNVASIAAGMTGVPGAVAEV